MPVRQKQKQSQNVKVIVNLAEAKRKRRRAKRRIKKIVQEQSGLRQQPNINISSVYQAPTIPRYINPIHAPITEASIQELRRVFLENMGQQTPSAETPNVPQAPTPIETPEPTPTSSVEEPIITPEEAPMEEVKAPRVRRTKAEKEEAIGMGLEDPNPLQRNRAERSALKRMGEQLAIQQSNIQGNITSPLGQRVADVFRKQQKGKNL